jgi:hypothetical protein
MRSLPTFFLLTYAVTWTCFFAVLARSSSVNSFFPVLLLYLGTFAPSLVALGISAWDEGIPGVRALLGRLFEWRAAAGWYLFAIGYMAAIKLAAALAYRMLTASWPRFGDEAWFAIVFAISFSTPVQAGEEIGWRAMLFRVWPHGSDLPVQTASSTRFRTRFRYTASVSPFAKPESIGSLTSSLRLSKLTQRAAATECGSAKRSCSWERPLTRSFRRFRMTGAGLRTPRMSWGPWKYTRGRSRGREDDGRFQQAAVDSPFGRRMDMSCF